MSRGLWAHDDFVSDVSNRNGRPLVAHKGSDGVHRTRRRMTDGHLTKKENEVFLRRLEKRGG